MDLEKLKSIIKFMDANNLAELEIEEDKQKIRLKKYQNSAPEIAYQPEKAAVAKPTTPEPAAPEPTAENQIKSPMVGTFYLTPSPGASPYVEIGQTVKKGDVICIIEAMKVMNEIRADSSGQITKILVENGQPVEFGQPLFAIKA